MHLSAILSIEASRLRIFTNKGIAAMHISTIENSGAGLLEEKAIKKETHPYALWLWHVFKLTH